MGILWPPSLLFLFSFFALPSSFFFLPSLLLFTHFTNLHFLPYYTISSPKNHFPKPLNFLSFISLNIFLDLCVLDHFCHKPIFETHLQTSIFLCMTMASSNGPPFLIFNEKKYHPSLEWISNGPSFLVFNEKKYHPSLEWNDEEGLLQDPKTHAPHSKMDFKVSFYFS